MRFDYECTAPSVSPMDMPSSNRYNPQSMYEKTGSDVAHEVFDVYSEYSHCNLITSGTISTSVVDDALHESMLIMGQSAAGTYQTASNNKDLEAACLQKSPASGTIWTCRRPPTSSMAGLMTQEHGQLNAGSNQGWRSSMSSSSAAIPVVKSAGGSLGISHDAGCIEQLLVYCMTAIESNDATSAQQLMWVLNNSVSTEGDPNQRVAAYFLRALICRAARIMSSAACALPHARDTIINGARVLSVIELARFVDLTPWHRFGFSASNGAIMEALEDRHHVHIVDFSITHCMQWPTLIEALSKRAHGPPYVRLTVHSARPHVPPLLDMSIKEVGMKLTSFARSKNVPFQFDVLPQKICELTPSCIEVQEGEMLVINCQMRARYISDEAAGVDGGTGGCSTRVQFMRWIKAVRPDMVTFVDEDADMGSKDAVSRLKAAFNYLWIPYDALDTFLPREEKQRMQYEGDIGSKIENIVACEGEERVERLESKERWMHRLRTTSNLQSIQFSEAVVAEVKSMLEEHAAGWSLKKDTGDSLLLTWKGHNVVFATACVPITTSS